MRGSAVAAALLCSLPLYLVLGYGLDRTELSLLWSVFAGLFALYFAVLWLARPEHRRWLWIAAVLFRLVLAFGLPTLSDDFHRFAWDGRISLRGESPFAELPAERVARAEDPGLRELYDDLNSPRYYTVYPPFCQAVFVLACALFPSSLLGAVVVMKLVVCACELASLWLLSLLLARLRLPPGRLWWYALNPLAIVELTGSLHFEAAMLCFTLLAVWLWLRERWLLAGLALGVAVAAKLTPLMFLPFFFRRLGWRRFAGFSAATVGVGALSFAPFLPLRAVPHFFDSLALYFRTFHFNSGLYRVLRTLCEEWEAEEWIPELGPLLGLAVALGIVLLALLERRKDGASLLRNLYYAQGLYLLGASIVNPWYVVPLLGFELFSRWRAAALWSLLLPLTYLTYADPPHYAEYWAVTALQYGALLGYLAGRISRGPGSRRSHAPPPRRG